MREPLDLEERLANLISDLIVPRLMPEIEVLPWRRTQVLAIQVFPSSGRPHYLNAEFVLADATSVDTLRIEHLDPAGARAERGGCPVGSNRLA